ncbi:hypothetical protein HK102_007809 [Quaeritorhiza haematococci]|nr:hypothetical protein HK102_007809 [Quaeritorhiza haematococci]
MGLKLQEFVPFPAPADNTSIPPDLSPLNDGYVYPYATHTFGKPTLLIVILNFLLALAGVIANLVMLVIMFRSQSIRSLMATNMHYVFLCGLVLTNVIFATQTTVMQAGNLILQRFWIGVYGCWVTGTLTVFLTTFTYMTATLFSVERYMRVVKCTQPAERMWMMQLIMMVGIDMFAVCIPFMMSIHREYITLYDGVMYCGYRWNSREPKQLFMSIMSIVVIESYTTIMIFCGYSLIRHIVGVKTTLRQISETIKGTQTNAQSEDLKSIGTSSQNSIWLASPIAASGSTPNSPPLPIARTQNEGKAPWASASAGTGDHEGTITLVTFHKGRSQGSTGSLATGNEDPTATNATGRNAATAPDRDTVLIVRKIVLLTSNTVLGWMPMGFFILFGICGLELSHPFMFALDFIAVVTLGVSLMLTPWLIFFTDVHIKQEVLTAFNKLHRS